MRNQLKIQIIKAPELEILTFKGGLIMIFLSSLQIIVAYCPWDAAAESIDTTALHFMSIHHLFLLHNLSIDSDKFSAKCAKLHKVSNESVSLASSILSSAI